MILEFLKCAYTRFGTSGNVAGLPQASMFAGLPLAGVITSAMFGSAGLAFLTAEKVMQGISNEATNEEVRRVASNCQSIFKRFKGAALEISLIAAGMATAAWAVMRVGGCFAPPINQNRVTLFQ